jgi:DegV family protein with EDD domain
MHIVTDRGTDLTPEQIKAFGVHVLPLFITLDGKTYRSGEDIEADEFYDLLAQSRGLPTTSLPAPGEIAAFYRDLARTDPEIVSVHISSGLSGTVNAARIAAGMVSEAQITVIDTRTLSAAAGWQVLEAAKGAHRGWSLSRILAGVERVKDAADTLFTVPDLKYLIHGGRISHLSGLLAQALTIKPLIGVDKTKGIYEQIGRVRTFSRAMEALVKKIVDQYSGQPIQAQVLHAANPDAAQQIKDQMSTLLDCHWLPVGRIAPVLGAHTGPGLVGVAFGLCAGLNE